MNLHLRGISKVGRLALAITALLAVASAAYAQSTVPTNNARPGEVIVKATLAASRADIDKVAADNGCDLSPIPYCPDYYLFRQKGVAQASKAAEPVSGSLQTLINTLKANPAVAVAEPNHVVKIAQNPTAKPIANAPKPQLAKINGSGKTRATAPPSNVTLAPNDPYTSRLWGLRAIRMPEAWRVQVMSPTLLRPSVVVGVADTGIDRGHPDFNATNGAGSRIITGQSFVEDGPNNEIVPDDWGDKHGHGTHCAGTVGATTDNGVGVPSVAGWPGNNLNVQFKIARVFTADGAGTDASITAGIGYLADQQVDVISLSIQGTGFSQIQQDTISRAISQGVVVVACAGNFNLDNDLIPFYPGDYPGVIKVTSIGPSLTKASYSNYGGPVAVAAPGGDGGEGTDEAIWSTWPTYPVAGGTHTEGYWAINGTSMACPHVAGVCALLIAAGAPRNAATIKLALQNTAKPLDETPDFNGHNKYGAGLVDAYSALLPFSDPPFSVAIANATGSGANAYRDRGQQYVGTISALTLQAIGVGRLTAQSDITVEVQSATVPTSVLRTLVGGTDFTVPGLPAGAPKATLVSFNAPGDGNLTLPAGRFKLVVKYLGAVVGTEFIEILARTQPIGRSMFAVPFKVRNINSAAPEQTTLGNVAQFSLARYNVQRLPSDFDYSLWQTAGDGRRDAAASFAAVAPDGSAISYDTSDPGVSIAPVGLGYWLNLDRAATVNPIGPEVGNSVAIRLFAANGGWNMIGAPFTASSAWGTVTIRIGTRIYTLEEAINQKIIAPALIGYTNGDYVYNLYPAGAMEPFNGYWVRVNQDCTMVIAPTSSTRAAAVPTRAGALPGIKGWRVRFGASVAGDRDGQNYFGMADGAAEGVDNYDVPKPPSGAGHAYVRFLTETAPGRSVNQAFDMRALTESGKAEWTAAVSTDRTNADVTLTWDGIGNVSGRNDLILTDTSTGKTIDMRGRSSYTFRSGEAGSTRKFTISLQPRLSTGPLAIRNVTVVASGRSTGQAGISVQFNTSREAEVKGVVKSLNGRVVADLTGTSRATAMDRATLRWNGRSRSGSPVPPGPYVVEITARSLDGSTSATFSQPFQSLQ